MSCDGKTKRIAAHRYGATISSSSDMLLWHHRRSDCFEKPHAMEMFPILGAARLPRTAVNRLRASNSLVTRGQMESPMCDFSLHSVRSRPAKVGDKLVTRDFGTGTRGFADVDHLGMAVFNAGY